MLYLFSFVLLFHALQHSLDIFSRSLNVGELEALVSTYFIKDDLFDMSVGY